MDLKFEEQFKISIKALWLNRSHPSSPRDRIWLLQLLAMFTVNFSCLFFVSYSIINHDMKLGNYTEVTKNSTVVIVFFSKNIKYMELIYYQKSIGDLIRTIDKDYELTKNFSETEKNIVIKYSKQGHLASKFWSVCALSACITFPIKALAFTAYSFYIGEGKLCPIFEITYPEFIDIHKNEVPVYISLFLLTILFTIFTGTVLVGFDPLIPIFTLHISGQLELLSLRMSQAISETSDEQEIIENLKKIVNKQQELYSFVRRCETNFKVLNEFNMKSTTIMVPLCGLQIVEYLRMNIINIEFYTLFSAALLHFLMPCYFNDLLMEKSEQFRLSIYCSGWETKPNKRIRQIILFMMTRASRPFGLSTVFYTISLDLFAVMCRQSYALFNLMNAAWG